MRALYCREWGPPESLTIEELPDPVAGDGQVVVRIEAAALNYPDVLITANRYQVSIPAPFIPGSEFAGVVESVGAGVTAHEVGDRVYGAAFVGAFAERIAVPETSVRPIPRSQGFAEAAAFGVVYGTAYHALRSVAEVAPGDWVVVLGAAGGVGLAAVELGKELGAKVIAAASSSDKLAVCAQHGADECVDYEREDLKERVKSITGGGADAVIDPVGGAYAEEALRATRWGGRFVTVGFASGEIPRIPLNLVLLKGVVVKGFEIRTFSQHAPDLEARDRAELDDLFSSGRLTPHVSRTFPLDDGAAALRLMADRKATGKLVITP